jgi:lipopolysaccharide/colanic/teichoic acid biosynthesis glycosyltransferase
MLFLTVVFLAGFFLRLFRTKGKAYTLIKPFWEKPLALVVLILSSPILFIAGFLIRLESRGPLIYRQQRIGINRRRNNGQSQNAGVGSFAHDSTQDRRREDLGGRPFVMYKLRSMKPDAEQETGPVWSPGDHDPRITKLGRYVRRLHLDELPQFYNVLVGDMSIIGPRPEREVFISQLKSVIDNYHKRLDVMPGITGLAQVYHKYDESLEDVKIKLEYDSEYVNNISFLLDAKIIILTVALILKTSFAALRWRVAIKRTPPKTPDSLFREDIPS